MYFSAGYIGVKLNQDFASSVIKNDKGALVICDGIGEFENSGEASRITAECFNELIFVDKYSIPDIIQKAQEKITSTGKKMGSTFICAVQNNENSIFINYLGNGGVIHLHGDFANHIYTNHPYSFTQLMLPHTTPEGALSRHISNFSGKEELLSSKVELTLNNSFGDILFLFSDGISSLEEMAIIKDENNRYWRIENGIIQFILKEFDSFLQEFRSDFCGHLLDNFLNETLHKLKINNDLEDDASLGIVMTQHVVNYYRKIANDKGTH
jgi:serine/threonine protein phosphatase PrpC